MHRQFNAYTERHNTILVTSSLVIFELQASNERGENDTPYVSHSDEKFIPSLWIQIEPLRFKVCGMRKWRRRATREFTKRAGHTRIYRLFLRQFARLTPDAHGSQKEKRSFRFERSCNFYAELLWINSVN